MTIEYFVVMLVVCFVLALIVTVLITLFDEKYMRPWRKGTVYE